MELNIDQKRIIETKPNGHMLVKGVAGSGKTTVAVNKIPHLLNHYCLGENDKVLVITYTKTLINYINHIYTSMDSAETLFSLLDNANSVDIKTVDSIIFYIFKQYERKLGKSYKVSYNAKQYNVLEHAIDIIRRRLDDQNIVKIENVKFLLEEIDWIKSLNIETVEEYQSIDRKGRMGTDTYGSHRLLKNSQNRKAIYNLMIEYDKIMEKQGFIDFRTMAIKVLEALDMGKIRSFKYPHIIIDESQDLTKVQLQILKKMYDDSKDYSSLVFVADTAQSIYSHSYLSHYSFKSVGFDMQGRSRILSKNYRTTTEIAKSAYSLIENDENITGNENYVKPHSIERHGPFPLYKNFKDTKAELENICNEINNRLFKKYDLKDIAIIARQRNQLIEAKNHLIRNNISAEILDKKNPNFDTDTVKLITMHSIKGLEFKVVIIIGINQDILPIKSDNTDNESVERKLLYVGMTRAKEELYLSSAGVESNFIGEINPGFLRDSNVSVFEEIHHVGIENYRFIDKVPDRYGAEEVVRQWVIDELINKLGYSQEMMDIEYKVKFFSRSGYVDIAIFKENNGGIEPFIFCEIKRGNTKLEDGLKQLKSYINTTKTVKYGLITNGRETQVYLRDKKVLRLIDKLPKAPPSGSSIEDIYEYIDLRKNKSYKMTVNKDDNMDINIYDGIKSCDIDAFSEVSVYGNIAAGPLSYASEDLQGYMNLPVNLLYDIDNCYMLKVTGDSMINAGIDKGDLVVVHKQNHAENLDIIVGIVDNEATLKKYTTMGNRILLMPENKNYEPILVNESDLIINGSVIGIIKAK